MRRKEDSLRAAILLSIVILTVLPMVVYAQPQESIQTSSTMDSGQIFDTVEPYEPISENLPGEMYTPEVSAPQSPGITISGTMKYVSETGAWLPMRQVRVVLMDEDFGPDETVASQYTDYSGHFSFTVNNDDGLWQGGRDPYVQVYSNNGAAYCKTGALIPGWYICQLPKCGNNVPEGFTYNYGTRAPASYNEAWQAIDACLGERDWVYWNSGYGGPWQRPTKVEVLWPKETWPHSHGDSIHLPSKSTANWNHATVYHEYAHCIMYALYGHFPSGSGPSPHYVYSESSEGFAMVEGWAEFMACAVDNKVTNLQGWYNGHGGNIETNDWYNCIDTGNMDGNIVEGSVASIFWDINDGTSAADRDYMFWGFDDMFVVMRYNQPDTINQFWTSWTTRWPTLSTSVGPMCTTYWQYGIDKDVYAPYGGSISINAGAAYTKSTYVTLTLSCNDWGSGVAYMRFRNSALQAWSAWYTYAASKSWTLSVGDGTKYVYVQFRDKKGLSATYSDSIILDTTLPTVTSVTVYPTKFNPRIFPGYTRIGFTLSEPCYVTIKIANSTGTIVRTLLNNVLKTAGPQTVIWNGRNTLGGIVPSGVYYIGIYAIDRAKNKASPYPIVKTVTVL